MTCFKNVAFNEKYVGHLDALSNLAGGLVQKVPSRHTRKIRSGPRSCWNVNRFMPLNGV